MNRLQRELALGAVIRLLPVFFPLIQRAALACVESLTPLNSWRSFAELAYYLRAGVPLYDGGADSIPPLLLVLGQILRVIPLHAIFAFLDVCSTLRIVAISRWYAARHGSPQVLPSWTACFFMFNPLLLFASLSGLTLPLLVFLTTELLYQACTLKPGRAAICLALASYMSIRSTLLLVPILALCRAVLISSGLSLKQANAMAISAATTFVATSGLLVLASYGVTGSFAFISSCYVLVLGFEKILPNVGLWWYLFTEMFEFFTPFYLVLFNVFGALPILPITIRLYEYDSNIGDSFSACIFCMIWLGFTNAYPSAGDFGYALALLPVVRHTLIPRCRYSGIVAVVLAVAATLLPIFYYCWIVLGTGNSNFFYSLNLVWGLVQVALLIDMVWAQLKWDFERQHNAQMRLSQM